MRGRGIVLASLLVMFGKRHPTVIGRRSSVSGSLSCGDDDARVLGQLVGSVVSGATITVEQEGRVQGDITGETVVVAGVVEGSVVARERLHMRSTGRILGDATYGTLEVDRGGVVKGQTRTMTSLPRDEDIDVVHEMDQLPPSSREEAPDSDPQRVTADWSVSEPA